MYSTYSYCIRGYVYSCTGTVGYVLDLRSSTAYGCPVSCILVQSTVPVSVPVVLWEYGLLRTSPFASHIRLYWYRYRYSQYWSYFRYGIGVFVVLRDFRGGLMRTSHFASHIRPYWYRYRYSQYWSNRSKEYFKLKLTKISGF